MKTTLQTMLLATLFGASVAVTAAPATQTGAARADEATATTQVDNSQTEAPLATPETAISRQVTDFDAMQEQAFQRYIEALKNYPPARSLPPEVRQRRLQMIEDMQKQHEIMMTIRKQRRQEFEQRRRQQLENMHRT